MPADHWAKAKRFYVLKVGAEHVAAIGNGRNDERMLSTTALGIDVIQREGTAIPTMTSADMVVTSVLDAFDLLLHPKRLIATFRS